CRRGLSAHDHRGTRTTVQRGWRIRRLPRLGSRGRHVAGGADALMRIIDLKCAVIGDSPVVRIVTDAGISGYAAAESYKPYLKPHVLFYKPYILDEDPTQVERVMLNIRHRGSFKPWGSAVSIIEMALWDLAGKAAGLPVHRLLGGKIRDRVRVYNGAVRFPMSGYSPQDYAENMARMKASHEGFTLIKQGIRDRKSVV